MRSRGSVKGEWHIGMQAAAQGDWGGNGSPDRREDDVLQRGAKLLHKELNVSMEG